MSEIPKTQEERRLDFIQDILPRGNRGGFMTKYGYVGIKRHPDCFTIGVYKDENSATSQMLFKVGLTGSVIAELDAEHISVWKDENSHVKLTLEDLIDEFYK
ncbi:hypothetical protein JW758_06045 [Candidatus Peregrinibacteria bacterium]|nr:hypothetical protein [Candidatus Peregrinibacteria bacterium]